MAQEQELTELGAKLRLTGVFKLTAHKIEGTNLCQLNVPCRYDGKTLTLAIYEDT